MTTWQKEMTSYLRVAASQFPVSGNMARNARYITAHMHEAATQGAHVIHFPETALPGYGPAHIASFEGFAWKRLESLTHDICDIAVSLHLWVILGSMRRRHEAVVTNCLHVIAPTGTIVGSYDKQRLYKREKDYYSPGNAPLVVEIQGFPCGFLICYDNCFPELYEAYRTRGVGLLFHSFHNADNRRATPIKDLMRANLITRAADHQMWISVSNSSTRYSPLSARIVRPDGTMVRMKQHVAGIVLDEYPCAELGWTYDNRKI